MRNPLPENLELIVDGLAELKIGAFEAAVTQVLAVFSDVLISRGLVPRDELLARFVALRDGATIQARVAPTSAAATIRLATTLHDSLAGPRQ